MYLHHVVSSFIHLRTQVSHSLAVMHCAAMTPLCKHLFKCYFQFLQTDLKVKLLNHMVVPVLIWGEWLHSPMVVLTCHGPSVYGLSAQPTLSDQGGSSSKGARSQHKMPLLSKSVGSLHVHRGFRYTEGIRTGVNPTIKQSLHPGSFRETAPLIISFLLSFPCYKV